MADEPTPVVVQPAINVDALASHVIGGVREALREERAGVQQAQQRQQQYQQSRTDPIQTQVIEPYVAPALRQMALMTAAARDAATFYNVHPEARPYAAEIERRFDTQVQTAMAQGGTPYDHASVWEHFQGQHIDHFARQRQEDLQRAAAQGATVGAPGVGRPQAQPFDKDAFRKLPLDEMEKAMGDRIF